MGAILPREQSASGVGVQYRGRSDCSAYSRAGVRAAPKSAWFSLLFCLGLLAGCDTARLTPLPVDAVILAFGDSLTYGTGAARTQAYPDVLAELTGYTVINEGVPGEVSADGARRLATALEQHKPHLVVLTHGGNDTLRNLPPERTRANLKTMIQMSRDRGAQVVMLAVPGRNLTLSAPDYYEEVAEALNVPIDASALPRLMRDRDMKSDPVHFNGEGYRRMAESVFALLRTNGGM